MALEDLSLIQASTAIREGSLSPVDYAEALLDRLERLEPRLEAWVTVDRAAVLAEARTCEAEAQRKIFRGPLHGIPFGVKDLFYTKGLRTTIGSPQFPQFQNFIPDQDAHAVAQLRQAGAIVLGKTVTTPFAYIDPGPTRNPWNTAHTPGGSSSGSAAAVAARVCPLATGSQTVGSVGRPAAYNGLVALVPTQRLVSRAGIFPVAWSLDHVAWFARSVADVELAFGVMAEKPARRPRSRTSIRVGVIRGFFHDNASDPSRLKIDALASRLPAPGFEVGEARLPEIFALGPSTLRIILRAEMAAAHETLYRSNADAYTPKVRALVETGLLIGAASYLKALRVRRIYQREMLKLFESFDVLMTPGARGAAPEGLSSTGDSIMNLPWALADFPTLSLPYGLDANGLPLGIQLSSAPMEEASLLEIGKSIEAVIGFNEKPNL